MNENTKTSSNQCQNDLVNMRRKILTAAFESSDGHIPSSFSILELIYVLFVEKGRKEKWVFGIDFEFILSKGHAALALYAILEKIGKIDSDWINNFSQFNSKYGGHPDYKKIREVGASTGSLGHGLPIAVGKVLANRANKKQPKVFCLVGDGELNEGSIWESSLIASQHCLHELVFILDANKSSDRAISFKNINQTFVGIGFETYEIDGHNLKEINDCLSKLSQQKPNLIIAHTVKGYGIPEMENNPAWHHLSPTQSNFHSLLESIK